MTLGEKLKALRAGRQLSQPELAAELGIEQSYLSKLENDKSIPSNEVFNKFITTFNVSLEEFLVDIDRNAELARLKQIPDLANYLSNKQQQNNNKHRQLLYLSSLLIVIATTLFYMGYSKQLFSELQFQYESDGIILADEPVNILDRWRQLLTPEQNRDLEFIAKKKLEMAKRINKKTIILYEDAGPHFRIDVKEGFRFYRIANEKMASRPINAWLQVFGVFLFSAGIMGFVLERRLFK